MQARIISKATVASTHRLNSRPTTASIQFTKTPENQKMARLLLLRFASDSAGTETQPEKAIGEMKKFFILMPKKPSNPIQTHVS